MKKGNGNPIENIIVYISMHSVSWTLCGSRQKGCNKTRKSTKTFGPVVLTTGPMGGSFPILFTSLNCRIHCHGGLWSSARAEQLQLVQVCWWHLSLVKVTDTDRAFGNSFGNTLPQVNLDHNYLGMNVSRICNQGPCSGGKGGTGLWCYIRVRLLLNWNS